MSRCLACKATFSVSCGVDLRTAVVACQVPSRRWPRAPRGGSRQWSAGKHSDVGTQALALMIWS
eukprot:5208784-Lingulodinium_polyedra.AAC.1